jgi:hypothetical protein
LRPNSSTTDRERPLRLTEREPNGTQLSTRALDDVERKLPEFAFERRHRGSQQLCVFVV